MTKDRDRGPAVRNLERVILLRTSVSPSAENRASGASAALRWREAWGVSSASQPLSSSICGVLRLWEGRCRSGLTVALWLLMAAVRFLGPPPSRALRVSRVPEGRQPLWPWRRRQDAGRMEAWGGGRGGGERDPACLTGPVGRHACKPHVCHHLSCGLSVHGLFSRALDCGRSRCWRSSACGKSLPLSGSPTNAGIQPAPAPSAMG